MKRVEVATVHIRQGCLYSKGIGLDDEGEYVHFIDHTKNLLNIQQDLWDYEENPEHGRPRVYLSSWQERNI